MKKKLWFRAKTFGWGWFPISWQGWVVTLLYTFGILAVAFNIPDHASLSDFYMRFAPPFVILTVLLLAICYKTGERPKWRWGNK